MLVAHSGTHICARVRTCVSARAHSRVQLLWLFIAWLTLRILKGRGYLAKGLITMRLQVRAKISMV
jgi:hypothetical protein